MADRNDYSQDVSIHDQTTHEPITTTEDESKLRLDVETESKKFNEGDQSRQVVTDDQNREVLLQILSELQTMNRHLAIISDEYMGEQGEDYDNQ